MAFSDPRSVMKRSRNTWLFTFFVIGVLLVLTLVLTMRSGVAYSREQRVIGGVEVVVVLEQAPGTPELFSSLFDTFADNLTRYDSPEFFPATAPRPDQVFPLDPVDREVFQQLHLLSQRTEGLYDVSLGSLVELYQSNPSPSVEQLDAAFERVGYAQLEWVDEGVRFSSGGQLFFRPMARAIAMDRAWQLVRELAPQQTGYIMVERDIVVFGPRNGRVPWMYSLEADSEPIFYLYGGALVKGPLWTLNPINGRYEASRFSRGFVLGPSATFSQAMLIAVSFLSRDQAQEFLDKRGIVAGLEYEGDVVYTGGARELQLNDNKVFRK
ncbi:MAG TPA: FAD:protein FMN transferase [Thermotogota bacterium]|nr:FAD:protein FMN transferase [Thermotogota bacterium]